MRDRLLRLNIYIIHPIHSKQNMILILAAYFCKAKGQGTPSFFHQQSILNQINNSRNKVKTILHSLAAGQESSIIRSGEQYQQVGSATGVEFQEYYSCINPT